jgi:hypothetical protein
LAGHDRQNQLAAPVSSVMVIPSMPSNSSSASCLRVFRVPFGRICVFVFIGRVFLVPIGYTSVMLPIGLIVAVFAWTAFAMAGVGVFFWAARWFPRQPWFSRLLVAAFVLLGLLARETKWAIPLIALLLLVASGFIPRKR